MKLGGKEVVCQSLAGQRVLWGPSFSPYSWTISPSLNIHNVVQITALLDGQYGGLGEDQMSVFHHRYNNALGALLRDDPMYAGIYKLDNHAGDAYYLRNFWKLRDVSVRYQLPDSWMQHIGASRGALTFAGNELAVLWANNSGTGVFGGTNQKEQHIYPQASILDVDYGRSAEGDGGHRNSPPVTAFHLRLDVTF
jgi:hypothetical protein